MSGDLYKPKSVSRAEVSEGGLHPLEPEERMILFGGPRRGGELHALYEMVKTQKQQIEAYERKIRDLEDLQGAAQAEERRIDAETLRQMPNDVRAKLERAVVVRCKNCVKRGTTKCPMYYDQGDYQYDEDRTIDDGFCDEGEPNT